MTPEMAEQVLRSLGHVQTALAETRSRTFALEQKVALFRPEKVRTLQADIAGVRTLTEGMRREVDARFNHQTPR